MTQPLPLELDAPGPWILHRIADREVYMRVAKDAKRVALRCRQGGRITDLGAACDLDRPGAARLVVHPHQDEWAKTGAVRVELLQRGLAAWRRYGTPDPKPATEVEAGAYVYAFWADLVADRVEISRRAVRPDPVTVDEHLGYADRPGSRVPEIRLRGRDTIPATLLPQMRALASEAWRTASSHGATGRAGAQR
jgi:hypothetical protein